MGERERTMVCEYEDGTSEYVARAMKAVEMQESAET